MTRRCECTRIAAKRCAVCGDAVCTPHIQIKVIDGKMEVVCGRCHEGKTGEEEG